MKTIKRGLVSFFFASLVPISVSAAEYDKSSLWTELPKNISSSTSFAPEVSNLTRYRSLQSSTDQLIQILDGAPSRSEGSDGIVVDLPLPNNKFVRFRMFSDSIMEAELAAKFPALKTYWGYDESDPSNRGRFDVTEQGFHGMFSYKGERIFIDPLQSSGQNTYINYRKRDATKRTRFLDRVVVDKGYTQQLAIEQNSLLPPTQPDGLLRSYRLAVATTGEYAQFHGGTVGGTLSAVVTAINRVNEVYEVDFSVRLNLVGNNDRIIYTNPNSDPYTNGNSDLNSNTGNINREIGSANYDIGHIFQTSGGGVAGLGVVCSSGKGRGLTGLQRPTGDPFYIDYVAHEIGHQFDALHTFNGTSGSCGGGNRSGSAAYEPGSGATVMAYAGICSDENIQNNSDPYFHTHSISEVNAFIVNGGGSNCASISNTNNTPPSAEAGANFTIPANTPFELTGSASDSDSGDNALLTYVWEQYDLGSSSSSPGTMVDNGNRPIFRSFTPTTNPTRTFPNLNDILNNTSTFGVSLPTTNRDLDFRLTVRDTKGGVAIDDMTITVANTGAAFAMTSPANDAVLNGGQVAAISWNAAGTSASPVNCSNVDVAFSSNNGTSFSTIASGLANSGNANITIPNSATNNARLKVRCSTSVFFAMSPRFNVQISGPNQAPVFTADPFSKGEASSGANYSATIAADATDPDGNPLAFSKTSGPAWLSVASDGSLSGIPSDSDLGVNSFTVTASDGLLSDSATMTITVTEAVRTVGITTVQSSTTTTQNRRAMPFIMPEDGTLDSISMYHDGGNGDMILAVYADDNGLPGNLIGESADTPVSSATGWQTIDLQSPVFVAANAQIWLAWIYETNPGIYYSSGSPGRANINATWSNGADNMPNVYGASTQANFRYSIYATYSAGGEPGNTAPTFASDPLSKPNATEGQGYGGTLSNDASDDDGDLLTFSKVGGPGWLTVDLDGSLSGTPTGSDVGANTFTVEVSDGQASDTAALNITVDAAGPTSADVGITTVGTSTSTSGNRRAMPFTMPEAGALNSISMFHDGGTGGLILAIYADNNGAPGALLSSTGETALNSASGWQTVDLQGGVSLAANESFWIAWIFESNPGIRYVNGSPGRAQINVTWDNNGDNMPTTFGNSSQSAFRYSIYSSYTPQ